MGLFLAGLVLGFIVAKIYSVGREWREYNIEEEDE